MSKKEKHQDESYCHSNFHLWHNEDSLINYCEKFQKFKVKLVGVGSCHQIFLTDEGKIYSQGDNSYGQLGVGDREQKSTVQLLYQFNDAKVRKIVCGTHHSVVLCDDGSIYCWGDSRMGQCGLKKKQIYSKPTKVVFPPTQNLADKKTENTETLISDISCGEFFTAAVDIKGMVWTWGSGLGLGHGKSIKECLSPKLIKSISNLKAIQVACGLQHCLVLTETYYQDAECNDAAPILRTSSISVNDSSHSNNANQSCKKVAEEKEKSSQFYLSLDDNESAIKSEKSLNERHGGEKKSEASNAENGYKQSHMKNKRRSVDVVRSPYQKKSTNFEVWSWDQQRSIDEMSETTSIRSLDIGQFSMLENFSRCEVWSWGSGVYGNHGHGDEANRYDPECISKLQDKCITRVFAGFYHSVAMSSDSKVYCWGDNSNSQLGFIANPVFAPRKLEALKAVRIWDIACGRNFTMFIGDSARCDTKVYFFGQVQSSNSDEAFSMPINASQSKFDSAKQTLSRSRRIQQPSVDEAEISGSFVHVCIREMIHLKKMQNIHCVYAYDRAFGCLTSTNTDRYQIIYDFTAAERLFFQELLVIQKYLVEPFLKTDDWFAIKDSNGGENLQLLLTGFLDLLDGISQELKHLTIIVRSMLTFDELFSFLLSDSFRGIYNSYSKYFSNAFSIGIINQCDNIARRIISKAKVIEEAEKKFLEPRNFEVLLNYPLLNVQKYCVIANDLLPYFTAGTPEEKFLKAVIERWSTFNNLNKKRLADAAVHQKGWFKAGVFLAEDIKDPNRKILLSSEDEPLKASDTRSQRKTFLLCNDVFVQSLSARQSQLSFLDKVWIESVNDTPTLKHAFKIISPEDSIVLCANDNLAKERWIKEIHRAIVSYLATKSLEDSRVTEVLNGNVRPESFDITRRKAEYIFTSNHPTYKCAFYKGWWEKAKPHGKGRISWPDKRFYDGDFVDGLFHGYGEMVWTVFENDINSLVGENNTSKKIYKGTWLYGNINGHGTMIYENGEEYTGLFKENNRHGHGTLKSYENNNVLHVEYVGNWENDMKSGYGVLVHHIRGEKYMGMWKNDARHGYGVVYKANGILYEGEFLHNKFQGNGTLFEKDGTIFTGEFVNDLELNGKGVFTFSNGHSVEGTFKGKWGNDISMEGNGKLYLKSKPLKRDRSLIQVTEKCSSLFNDCRQLLGHLGPMEAWQRLQSSMMDDRSSANGEANLPTPKLPTFDEILSLNKDLPLLKDFLAKEIESPGHPIRKLIDKLVELFHFTYISAFVQARLIEHAVGEISLYMAKLLDIIKILLPDVCYDRKESEDEVIKLILDPLIIPRVYDTLISLYVSYNKDKDQIYTKELKKFNRLTDDALFDLLLIRESDDRKSSNIEAIKSIQNIPQCKTPLDKIKMIRQALQRISEGKNDFAADRAVPLFVFVVIRARISHLNAEVHFIDDMIGGGEHMKGSDGYALTTLQVALTRICEGFDEEEDIVQINSS